ncbi:GNAT family N-acetyltransferase [Sedimentitalea sp. HM32M-2]|uniref:GNAT family N-acetyltransferase n=1 Tax=Sedimentitalea sp. HM32M-2 TaxID=3351566 RepID=UPI0036292FAF
MTEIVDAQTPEHLAAVRHLCWEYRDFLRGLGPLDAQIVDLFYPKDKYARLMDRLAAEHAPPGGAIRLAMQEGVPVGCGMFHTLAPGTAEIKRVYVTQAARGTGAGRALMQALIAQCRRVGFARILMDTSKPLTAAQALYVDLGFRPRGPYQPVPEPARDRLLFFEMAL